LLSAGRRKRRARMGNERLEKMASDNYDEGMGYLNMGERVGRLAYARGERWEIRDGSTKAR